MISEHLSFDEVWAAHDASMAEEQPEKRRWPSKRAVAAASSKPFDVTSLIASTKALHASAKPVASKTKHVTFPEFEETAWGGMMAPKVSQLGGCLTQDGMRELDRRNLRIGHNICITCAQAGCLQACVVEYANAEATCVKSAVVLHKVSANEIHLMPYREAQKEDDVFSKTALDTFTTRKGYTGTPCGYCGSNKREETISHELVDVGQFVKAFCYESCWTDEWLKRVKYAVANGTPLPLRACSRCVELNIHLKSTCLSNYAIVRKPRPRKKEQERDEEDAQAINEGRLSWDQYEKVQSDKKDREDSREAVHAERMYVAKQISRHHASTQPARNTCPMPDPDFSDEEEEQEKQEEQNDSDLDIWERSDEEQEEEQEQQVVKPAKGEEDYYLPPYLSQMKDGFKVFDREFHSCLLNSAIGLNHLLNQKLLTAGEVKAVITAIFNNSRFRMQREAGIKTQLVTRIGTMPGSPLKAQFEAANNHEFQNQLGTLVEAFVEEHLLSVLLPIALGQETGRTHLEWNRWLDQMSGFGVGNQSTDALMMSVYWQWKSRGFRVGYDVLMPIPRLEMFLTEESMAFYDFNTWVPKLRLAERNKGTRPQAEHELYRLQTGDDQALCSTRGPKMLYKLRGYLYEEPDRKVYQSEGFCAYAPDDKRKKNKTWRYEKLKDVYGFRGALLHKAGARLQFYANLGFDKQTTDLCEEATQWLLLRPEHKPAANGLRSNQFIIDVLQPPPPVVIATETTTVVVGGGSPETLELHPKQKVAGKKPVSVSIQQIQLPRSAAAAARLHHPVAVASKNWNRLLSGMHVRMQRAEVEERLLTGVFSYVRKWVLLRRQESFLGVFEPPMTTPLAGGVEVEKAELMRLKSPSPVAEKSVVEPKGKGIRKKGKGKALAVGSTKSANDDSFVPVSASKGKFMSAVKKKKAQRSALKEMEDEEQQFQELSPAQSSASASCAAGVMTASSATAAVAEATSPSPVPCEKRGSEEGDGTEDAEAKRPKQQQPEEPDDPELLTKLEQMRRTHLKDKKALFSPTDEQLGGDMPSDSDDSDDDSPRRANANKLKSVTWSVEPIPDTLKMLLRPRPVRK
jgi:regulation of enolase protein 1 (concanavalin A-like superfamily)